MIKYKKLDFVDNIKTLNLKSNFTLYKPHNDSYLFLMTLNTEINNKNLNLKNGDFILEVGFGTGFIINNFINILKNKKILTNNFAVDINIDACFLTKEYLDNSINVLNMDLLSNFKNNLFDVIIFNPPYVPTDSKELQISKNNISKKQKLFNQFIQNDKTDLTQVNCYSSSYAGGIDGIEVINVFIENINKYLNKNGVLYLLLDECNKIEIIKEKLFSKNFKKIEDLSSERFYNENLIIIKCYL